LVGEWRMEADTVCQLSTLGCRSTRPEPAVYGIVVKARDYYVTTADPSGGYANAEGIRRCRIMLLVRRGRDPHQGKGSPV
jgi:hypothetical protein